MTGMAPRPYDGDRAGSARSEASALERPVPSVSAIVPLFNEQTTVARVVETLAASRLIEEVICVDDGSTDESRAVLEAFGEQIVLVACGSNGRALAEGLGRARRVPLGAARSAS